MKNGMIECSACHSKIANPSSKAVSRAYDRHRSKVSSKQRALNFLLVGGDCVLVGFQPILVYMSKVDGRFKFSPISVNFLTELAKVLFAITMLLFQARRQKVGEKPLLSLSTFMQAARNNKLLAVPALLYAINNYLKFTMQVLVIAVLLKFIMKRRFSIIQWEALALLLIGISINQLKSMPEGTTTLDLPITTAAYMCTLIFVSYSGHLDDDSICIYDFGFLNADTILKKYSSTVATIFTGIASAALFGHTLTINFLLGISVVFISMHQFFSPFAKPKDEEQNGMVERTDVQDKHRSRDSSFINMAAGANEEATHRVGPDERQPLLPK
ncbi:hypothetical protein SASPL_101581 [Salvia splendens]|uniref:Solute carrier family 35 (UDP-sugar transporter), member A1/2/3 n=1 Tax=Salvia splendens TaxID=180675 RepID=A0A8X9ADY2_SALSN|nr:hypothetical protein SASPL_101581 [Salvia splendens]